ncbi:MAG: hypothetical protein A2X12_11160 [Bacteroidetes bacterium GWE2_29_8]|nr:MAG: hypothetical protein A2X12_11160 [Bacteroidetes bacterium GWE2_29_8]OFY22338.1 MAG: hypothetical protein A2X02_07640 [Bacteroidetes bacterium GWF2_29_10]
MPLLKLLIVDDEPGICSGVRRILENYKITFPFMEEAFEFVISEAPSGEDAVKLVDEITPDIVLLDNQLPGRLQGIDVLEYINKKDVNIIVIMITSYASLELAVKATKNGAYDFVPKPFTPKELRTSIETVVKQLFLKKLARNLVGEGRQIRFQFLSVLSHELKAPLNAIEGYLKLMKQQTAGDHIEDYTEMIDRSLIRVEGMRTLILDLLDITKIESGKKVRDLKQLNIYEIARTCVDTVLPYAIQKDVDVYLNASKEIFIQGDQGEIEIILNNLLSNAVKYNINGGRVDIIITIDENHLKIIVQDTGIGISKEEQESLFNDFFRAKNERTKKIQGTGLGLSILKKIVELYNGDIQVKSEPNKGSCFTVRLKI